MYRKTGWTMGGVGGVEGGEEWRGERSGGGRGVEWSGGGGGGMSILVMIGIKDLFSWEGGGRDGSLMTQFVWFFFMGSMLVYIASYFW